jgi:hypothetical protein
MPLTLTDVERMAREIARDEDPALEVVAARNGEGAADYTEVILTLNRSDDEPARLVIGVTRNATEDDIRRLLRNSLRDHLQALN